MGYPPQQYPQQGGQPPQAYGQPPAAPGYPQQGGYQPAPQQGYAQPQQPQGGGVGFGEMWNQADHSGGGGMDNGEWPVIITESVFDRTRGGDKWCWTVKFTGSADAMAGRRMTTTVTISPENEKAMGIMFRHLGAMGIPVPPPDGPPGTVPFWDQVQVPAGSTPDQALHAAGQYAAQLMNGKPCRILVGTRAAHGEYAERQEVKDIRPPKAGDPTSLPQPGQAAPQQAQAPGQGYVQQGQQPPQPFQATQAPQYPPQQPAPQGYPQQAPQPVQGQQWAASQPQGQPPQQAVPQGPPQPYQANGAAPPVPPQQAQPAQPGQDQGGPPPPPWAQG